jgi:hypothetical protein
LARIRCYVLLDGRFADPQTGRNLLVRQATGDVAGDLELARCQDIEDRGRTRNDRHPDHEERHAELLGGREVNGQASVSRRGVVDREHALVVDRGLGLLRAADRVAKPGEVVRIEMKVAAGHRSTVADARRTSIWQ